ncbi:type II toxin-antitoxin system HicA family toxin [Candidatus Peregrinibacteria bacterium]|nr:type II toxin-antitoxin system HicA family toxin [Candidatus Peregrinibacteria bacterium]MBI3816155.1 type II toxin-antitoxin system HicA family toxin [Candidatus Peregrinibacteria bacterium]
MNPKLPIVSGREAVSCFERLGYRVVRQRGSHIRLHHPDGGRRKPLTIPDHHALGKGLLRKLLRDADISIERFLQLL